MMLGSAQAMRMESAHTAPDWQEGSQVIGYAGTLVTVYFSAGDAGVEIDGIEHAGLTLDADDLSESMRAALAASLRAQWDLEAA